MTNKDKIKALTEREKGRDVSVWFESRSNYIHPLKEIVANATDEINNNFQSGEIFVKLYKDLKTVSIRDTGRGLPIHTQTDGVQNYELLLLTLFAGTNYDNNDNGKITTGQHGLGLTVTNYCSSIFEVTSYIGDYIYNIQFKNGGGISKELSSSHNIKNTTGTEILFKLDEEVFNEYSYNADEIKDILNKIAGSNKKITIHFELEDVEKIDFHYEGIQEYFETITNNNTCEDIVGLEKCFNLENELNKIELIFCTSSEPIQQSFLNITHLPDGGTINDGIIEGVKLYVNKHCKENKLINPKQGSISNSDIEDSLSFVCNVMSVNAEFANQTKLATKKKLYKTLSKDYAQELLEIYRIEKPKEFDKLVKHILEVRKFNDKSQANKKALKKKLSEKIDSIHNRVEGLVDCVIHGEEAELYITEGKSALGSVVLARNPYNQAATPVRGKTLNCLKASYQKIFDNDIVVDLVKILGCGIETDKKNKDLGDFNIKGLRYGKIIIATDQDADGFDIQVLLLTLFYRLMSTLIKDGYIYIAKTPLYEVKLKNDKVVYWYSEEERNKEYDKLKDSISVINRSKGLGELESEVMNECAMNPETRHLTQVTIEDIEAMNTAFQIWMDKDVAPRKAIIQKRLNKYNNID